MYPQYQSIQLIITDRMNFFNRFHKKGPISANIFRPVFRVKPLLQVNKTAEKASEASPQILFTLFTADSPTTPESYSLCQYARRNLS